MALIFRIARDDDQDALGTLKLKATLAWGDHIDQLRSLPEARTVSLDHLPNVVLAEFDGEIVGFITILTQTDHIQAEVEDLFVAPAFWRRGLGRALLMEGERRTAQLGTRSLHVVAGDRARPFYETCGFEFVGTVPTDFEVAVELRKGIL